MDHQKIRRLVDQVKAHLHKTYGESILRVILYGHYAGGEATRDSDVDVPVRVAPSSNRPEVDDTTSGRRHDTPLNGGELVSAFVLSEDDFENHDLSSPPNVREEGVLIGR